MEEIVNKKRLLTLTTSYPRFKGDHAGSFIHAFINKFINNFDCTILAPDYFDSKNSKIENHKVVYFSYFYPRYLQRLCYGYGIVDNIRRNPLTILQIPIFLFSFFLSALKLGKNSDIIHSHWLFPSGLIGAFIKKIYNIPHIITIHSGGFYFLTKFPFSSCIIRLIYNNSDYIVCVSSELKNELVKRTGNDKKISIIPMGVEIGKGRINNIISKNERSIRKRFIIFYIGRLVKIKGVEYLIKAISKLNEIELIIAGDGYELNKLILLSKKLGVNTKFVGYVSGKKKKQLYESCDVVVVPSIQDKSGRTEGMPLVILEAFSYCKPVIASNVGGIKDVINNGVNGFLVEPASELELREKIIELQLDNKYRYILGNKARETAEFYKLGRCITQYKKIYDKILISC